jgi:cytosine/uracil/thiamine/allantoin permease
MQLAGFLVFWAVNMGVIYLGLDQIRFLPRARKALILLALGCVLAWAYHERMDSSRMLAQPSQFGREVPGLASSGRLPFLPGPSTLR